MAVSTTSPFRGFRAIVNVGRLGSAVALAVTLASCAHTYSRSYAISGTVDQHAAFDVLYELPTHDGSKRKIRMSDRYAKIDGKVFVLRPSTLQPGAGFDPSDVLEVRLKGDGRLELFYQKVGAARDFDERALERMNAVLKGSIEARTGTPVEIFRARR